MAKLKPEELLGMESGVVRGIISDLARNKAGRDGEGMSRRQIVAKWDVSYGKLQALRNIHHVAVEEAAQNFVTKGLLISDTALNAVMADLQNPELMEEMKTREKMDIAVKGAKIAGDMANGGVGAGSTVNISFSEMKVAMQVLVDMGKGKEVPVIEI